jgi:hypothetical protein
VISPNGLSLTRQNIKPHYSLDSKPYRALKASVFPRLHCIFTFLQSKLMYHIPRTTLQAESCICCIDPILVLSASAIGHTRPRIAAEAMKRSYCIEASRKCHRRPRQLFHVVFLMCQTLYDVQPTNLQCENSLVHDILLAGVGYIHRRAGKPTGATGQRMAGSQASGMFLRIAPPSGTSAGLAVATRSRRL